jgi:ribosomal protein S18 acetylase RimI-like enzyme
MRLGFRTAQASDFEYCARLYLAGMDRTIEQLKLDRSAHLDNFRRRWEASAVRIITRDGADVGWLQSRVQDAALLLAQLFVEPAFQHKGIGSEVMHHLIAEAAQAGAPVTLGVVKTNPALRLYQRLGFQVTHEDDRKFYMRRESDGQPQPD